MTVIERLTAFRVSKNAGKVRVGNGQEMSRSKRNSHSKKPRWENTRLTHRKPSEQLFPNSRPLSYPNLTKT